MNQNLRMNCRIKYIKLTLLTISLCSAFLSFPGILIARGLTSQETDTVIAKKPFPWKQQIAPAALIAGGLCLSGTETKKNLQEFFPRTDTRIDNYLQWAPGGIMYVADIFTGRHRNNVWNQTKYLGISLLATSAITQLIKVTTNVTRPNGGNYSFPSGHTSNAFAGATVLFREYYDYNRLIGSSGYLVASATGILRVTNNRHWVPDVLVGAGIGIIITNLVYYFEPLKNWDPFKLSGKDKVALYPARDPMSGAYTLAIRIKL